ncbi:hypothetical protein [Achromobacter denitrificans]|uniref:hypothetical protein n=1 Tax=Achromobacter denitrificans TaxID=32002 RepID=UPI000B49084D|nr:hypothetical protein [Achromobacter denitrificans]
MTQQWKPITSAPKDGTEILVWRSDCGQFIASYTSADAFPMTQDELDAWDEETLFAKDWFTQWPQALRLEGSEVPTLWQPLPVDPCQTCNDQGAVGNILNAEPCPDCTPPASAQDDAKDERQAFEAWAGNKGWTLSPDQNNCGIVVAERYGHRAVQTAWEAWQARASVAAPAAGDALLLTRALDLLERNKPFYGQIGSRDVDVAASLKDWDEITTAMRSALSASQQQEG